MRVFLRAFIRWAVLCDDEPFARRKVPRSIRRHLRQPERGHPHG